VGIVWLSAARDPGDSSGQPEFVHHTSTQIRKLATIAQGDDPVWVEAAYERNIWIHPDGAGRILESDRVVSFPTNYEQYQANTLTTPIPVGGVDDAFPIDGLTYFSEEELLSRIDEMSRQGASSADVIQLFSSFLTEEVPGPRVVDAAIVLASSVPSFDVRRTGALVTVTSNPRSEQEEIIGFTVDPIRGLITSETRIAPVALDGLDLPPPIRTFQRLVIVAEDLAK
jgi:hypothetical protein